MIQHDTLPILKYPCIIDKKCNAFGTRADWWTLEVFLGGHYGKKESSEVTFVGKKNIKSITCFICVLPMSNGLLTQTIGQMSSTVKGSQELKMAVDWFWYGLK